MAQIVGNFDSSADWRNAMFVEHANEFSNILDQLSPSRNFATTLEAMTSSESVSGNVLDLGCGPGRYTGALASKAKSVVGIDFSESLLAIARQRHELQRDGYDCSIEYHHADMRELPRSLGEPFSLIVRLYTSLGYFSDTEEESILSSCRALAGPEACLVIDTFNGEFFKRNIQGYRCSKVSPSVDVREYYVYDHKREVIDCSWEYIPKGEAEFCIDFSLNYYDREKIEAMLSRSGWIVKGIYSDFGIALPAGCSGASPRLIVVARVV